MLISHNLLNKWKEITAETDIGRNTCRYIVKYEVYIVTRNENLGS